MRPLHKKKAQSRLQKNSRETNTSPGTTSSKPKTTINVVKKNKIPLYIGLLSLVLLSIIFVGVHPSTLQSYGLSPYFVLVTLSSTSFFFCTAYLTGNVALSLMITITAGLTFTTYILQPALTVVVLIGTSIWFGSLSLYKKMRY